MTTIYLHIGMPKTGTTCLQKALFNNRDKFLETGYLYPMSGIKHNAREIVNRYCHNTLAHFLMGLEDKDNTLSMSIWEELKTEIDFINPKNVIISAEAFTSFEIFYQPETLAKIKDLLKEYEIKVVIYLRKQDDFLEFSYCYMVKLGACSVGIKELINNLNERVLARFIKLDDSYWSNYQKFLSFLSDNKTICKLVSMLPNVLIDDLLLLPKEKEDIMRQFQESNSQIAYKYLGQKDGVLFGDSS
ncbi:hypothetical protein [Nostoc sp. DedQUE07]|uniref:hypothetical protein n=1 Tax=Nostoc sp. DedQUE07 TaxID=3075392 RepID=UPI002AD35696|nr:hypothetical protein [Nostoc sp. DedQUE07]MDZ8128467.1 hypothetical protein [Nostoc sp. DedQUE07]